MRKLFLLILPILLLFCSAFPSLAVEEVPILPALCYGEITINKNPAPAGVIIEAVVDGASCGKLITTEDGYFGGPGKKAKLAISSTQKLSRKQIEFYLSGNYGGVDFKQIKAGETSYWGSGEIVQINLEASLDSSPPPSPPPGPSPSPGGGSGKTPEGKKLIDSDKPLHLGQNLIKYETKIAINGQKVEHFAISPAADLEITRAKSEGVTSVEINLKSKDDSAMRAITLPSPVIRSARDMDMLIKLPDLSLHFPSEAVNSFMRKGTELKITIQSGDKASISQQIEKSPEIQDAKIIGRPIEINSTITGEMSITMLLNITLPADIAEKNLFLSRLAVFAIHEDGQNEVLQLKLATDKDSNQTNIVFKTDRFSTFAIIELPPMRDDVCSDISGTWAEDSIKRLLASGTITGYPDGTFRPDKYITRSEFTSILVRALDLAPAEGKVFSDTRSHWAKDYITTAYHYGIVHGLDNTTFAPQALITREQIAVMVVNAVNLEEGRLTRKFTDESLVSVWAKGAIVTAVHNQIINGYPDGSLRPLNHATRAEVAQIITRTLDLVE